MMITSGQKSLPAIGFLTITRDAEHGLFGGYLVLNSVGRPLEFHCTAPVRPNRAQEILYGPTLESYLYGERIGPTLLEKSKSTPLAVFTDVESAMAARQFVSIPMLLVLSGSETSVLGGGAGRAPVASAPDGAEGWRHDSPHAVLAPPIKGLSPLGLGKYRLAYSTDFPRDGEVVRDKWPNFADQIELDEPFGRIREAIDEARGSAR